MKLYSVKDVKAASYFRPFPSVNDQVAIRDLKSLVNSKESEISNYPEDYELWYIGDFDEKIGTIVSDLNFLVNCQDLKEVKNDDIQ